MALTVQCLPLFEAAADWLIVPVFDEDVFSVSLAALDSRLGGTLSRLRQAGDVSGKPNELTALLDCQGTASQRILIVGLGKREEVDRIALTEAAAAGARYVTDKHRRRV